MKEDRASKSDAEEDPDIAGIVPGPQPLPPEFGDMAEDRQSGDG